MTRLRPVPTDTRPRPSAPDREVIAMLLHEALARSRQREAEEVARRHALARRLTAGRRWARLARFAARRAEHAQRAAGVAAPLHGPVLRAVGGHRGAV
ncbi:MAG TPA: hypothetical protein VM367_07350 [Pseudonocardia sp.]|nr:hypothetical protein [Pseudonocardia sp.]HWH02028.1 hypothetical protein [Pilimelia sp.]